MNRAIVPSVALRPFMAGATEVIWVPCVWQRWGGLVDLFFKKLPGDLEIWWDLCILQEIENRSCQFEPRHYPWSCLNWPPRIQELQNPRIRYTYLSLTVKFVASIPSRCLPSSPIQRKFNSGQRCLQVCSRWSASDKSIAPEGLVMVATLTLNR